MFGRSRWWCVGLALALACGDDDGSGDAGPVVRCTSDEACNDGLFCNGVERCRPDADEADPDGCVPALNGPCTGECDEASDTCGSGCIDADGDGFADVVCGGQDCDDGDMGRYPSNIEICDLESEDEDCDLSTFGDRDIDGDGFVDARCCNGSSCGEDCDETRRGSNPNVPEVCDGRDNDCDGMVDEELLEMRFVDADRDLHGDPDQPIMACPGRSGTSASSLDCNDNDPTISSPQTEVTDGRDNDCDGRVDEEPGAVDWYPDVDGDGYGDSDGPPMRSSSSVPGHSIAGGDCDDTNADVSPAAQEQCNAIDDDCAPDTAFENGVNDWEDDDLDGYPDAICAGGAPNADCDDTDPSSYPNAPEKCDARDNDCDGVLDEGCSDLPPPMQDGGPPMQDAGPPMQDAGPCMCFSEGTWQIDNLAVCFGATGSRYYASSTNMTNPMCPSGMTPNPIGDWSTNQLTADCSGTFDLCYAIRVGDFDTPEPTDCTIHKACTGPTAYVNVGEAQSFPQLPRWVEANSSCAEEALTGFLVYGEITVTGTTTSCGDVGASEPLLLGRIQYCPLDCGGRVGAPDCMDCMGTSTLEF